MACTEDFSSVDMYMSRTPFRNHTLHIIIVLVLYGVCGYGTENFVNGTEKMSQKAEAAYSREENEENQRTTKIQSCFTMHSTKTIHSFRFWQGIARGILLVKLVKATCCFVDGSIHLYLFINTLLNSPGYSSDSN